MEWWDRQSDQYERDGTWGVESQWLFGKPTGVKITTDEFEGRYRASAIADEDGILFCEGENKDMVWLSWAQFEQIVAAAPVARRRAEQIKDAHICPPCHGRCAEDDDYEGGAPHRDYWDICVG